MTQFTLHRHPLLFLWKLVFVLLVAALVTACSDNSDKRYNVSIMANHFQTPVVFTDVFAGKNEEEQLAIRAQLHLDMIDSDFFGRIDEMANQVDEERPDILIMHAAQDPQFTGPVVDAEALHQIQMMIDALTARGLSYSIVAERDLETYGTVPLVYPACEIAEPIGACTTTPRFKDYLLVNNQNRHLELTNVETHNFINIRQLPPLGPYFSENYYKGWTTVDGKIRNRSFRIVDVYYTRADAGELQVLQTQELIAGPLQFDGALIVSVNSKSTADANPDITSTGYPMLLAVGLTDTWQNPNDSGHTCCQSFHLDNPVSILSRRDDYILVNDLAKTVDARLLGTVPFQETSPFWTGDHAVSVAEVKILSSEE